MGTTELIDMMAGDFAVLPTAKTEIRRAEINLKLSYATTRQTVWWIYVVDALIYQTANIPTCQ